MRRAKVVVADGRRLFGEALGIALAARSDFNVVPEHPSSGLDVIDLIVKERPEVALVDHWLDRMMGPAVAATLRRRAPYCRVLLMSSTPSGLEVQDALDSGARGFISRCLTLNEVLAALEDARAGRYPVIPGLDLEIVVDASRAAQPEEWKQWGQLTRREIEVLELLSLHGRRDALAEALGTRRATIDNHIERILKKTGTLSQADAIHAARQAGVLTSLPPDHRATPASSVSVSRAVSRNSRATVLVADPSPVSGEALSIALARDPRLSVLQERPASAAEAAEAVERARPDVAVVDYWLPGFDGTLGIAELTHKSSTTKVLLLSWLQSLDHIQKAMASDAVGFLPTSITISELVEAISLAKQGTSLVYAERITALAERISRRHSDAAAKQDALASLTARELAVLGGLSHGHSRTQVAKRLAITPATMDVHVRNILRKTGAGSSLEAVTMAQRGGILPV